MILTGGLSHSIYFTGILSDKLDQKVESEEFGRFAGAYGAALLAREKRQKEIMKMELIKDLPEVFEEFAEQRQKSFLAVKELKEKGVPVVGSYCTYFPKEIAMAMGAGCVSLCSTSDETIPEAEKGSSEESLSADQIKLWICKDRQMSILLFLRRSSWGNNL